MKSYVEPPGEDKHLFLLPVLGFGLASVSFLFQPGRYLQWMGLIYGAISLGVWLTSRFPQILGSIERIRVADAQSHADSLRLSPGAKKVFVMIGAVYFGAFCVLSLNLSAQLVFWDDYQTSVATLVGPRSSSKQ